LTQGDKCTTSSIKEPGKISSNSVCEWVQRDQQPRAMEKRTGDERETRGWEKDRESETATETTQQTLIWEFPQKKTNKKKTRDLYVWSHTSTQTFRYI